MGPSPKPVTSRTDGQELHMMSSEVRIDNGSQDRVRGELRAVPWRAYDVTSRTPGRARSDLWKPQGSNPLGLRGRELLGENKKQSLTPGSPPNDTAKRPLTPRSLLLCR